MYQLNPCKGQKSKVKQVKKQMIINNWTKISSQDQQKLYLSFFIAIVVFISKRFIIIYNEEVLVALTFFAFVFFIYKYFGDGIKEFLDDRCFTIQQELETFFVIKKDSLTQALQQHRNVSCLMKSLTSLIEFNKQLLRKASQHSVVILNSLISHHIKQKLSTLLYSTTPLESQWNRLIASYQLPLVLAHLESTQNQGLEEFTSAETKV